MTEIARYADLLAEVRARVASAQVRAVLAANHELLRLYWDIGRMIDSRQDAQGWGAQVIPRLSRDIRSELPGIQGFSERNLKRMLRFYREYPSLNERALRPLAPRKVAAKEVPPPVAQMSETHRSAMFSLPWGHHILLIERVKDPSSRVWYLERAVADAWSRDVLALMIRSAVHTREGTAVTNFAARLPSPHSDLAQQALKDPYIFDFLALDTPFHERELEGHLLAHLERFLLELGKGFAFVGRQHRITLDGDDFYLDLLFYHLKLRCFVVIDLKVGPFKAEYAGKMNLYLNLVDDTLRHADDHPSIGLILCQDQKRVLAEYALRGMDKPIGVSEYELTRALPTELRSALPTIDEIEAELGEEDTSVTQ